MENPYVTPQGSIFQFSAQQSQTGPSESFARSFRDMDYDAIAGMTPSHMYVREENLFNESVHEVTVGDPAPTPRLGRRLMRRHVDETAHPSPVFSRPDSSASSARSAASWKRTHRHSRAGADPSPPSSYTSDMPTQMYEEIQLSRDMQVSDLSEEERWNIFADMSSMNATDRDWPHTAQSEQESSLRKRYKTRPPPAGFPPGVHKYPEVPFTQQKQQYQENIQEHSPPATNWQRRSPPPRRRRATFKYRPGPTTQPRRLFDGESSSEVDDFADVRGLPAAGPALGAAVQFASIPAAPAYASPVPGPSGLQPPPYYTSPCVSPDSSLWRAPQESGPPPPHPASAPCRGKGKAIPGKALQVKRGRARSPPTARQLTDGLPFVHPTESRPCTAPSMFLQQDWSTSCLPDNYYPSYCRGPLPRVYN